MTKIIVCKCDKCGKEEIAESGLKLPENMKSIIIVIAKAETSNHLAMGVASRKRIWCDDCLLTVDINPEEMVASVITHPSIDDLIVDMVERALDERS